MSNNDHAQTTTHPAPQSVKVVPATVLDGGRYRCHLTIPSSRFARTAAVSVAEPETVASVERRLSRAYGEAVEVTDVAPVDPPPTPSVPQAS